MARNPELFVQSDMGKLTAAREEFQRLSVFHRYVGAPFADKRPADLIGVADARPFSVGPAGSDWRRDGAPLGVIHPEVLGNPDDGVYRHCYGQRHLSFISLAERKVIRARGFSIRAGDRTRTGDVQLGKPDVRTEPDCFSLYSSLSRRLVNLPF
jgi:hypothetical protein